MEQLARFVLRGSLVVVFAWAVVLFGDAHKDDDRLAAREADTHTELVRTARTLSLSGDAVVRGP